MARWYGASYWDGSWGWFVSISHSAEQIAAAIRALKHKP